MDSNIFRIIICISVIQPLFCHQPLTWKDGGTSEQCTTFLHANYSQIYCVDSFEASFTEERFTTRLSFTCLSEFEIKIPPKTFLPFKNKVRNSVESFEATIKDCNISQKFLTEFKEATKFIRNDYLEVIRLVLLGAKDSVLTFDKDTLTYCEDATCEIHISYPYVADVESIIFPYCSVIYFENSNLTSLVHGMFDNVIDLHELSLENNQIDEIIGYVFKNLTRLRRLNLSWNQLTNLDTNMFYGLKELRELKLSGNLIQNLPPKIFSYLNDLRVLYLNNNPIVTVNSDAFEGIARLSEIKLHSCHLVAFDSEIFKAVQNFPITLDISNNSLAASDRLKLNNNFWRLFLSSNNLSSITSKTIFRTITNTEILEMRNCGISVIYPEFLINASALRYLDLGENLIQNLPPNFLPNCTSIFSLRLDHNQLREIDNYFFEKKKICFLYLNHNKLTTINDVVFRNLTELEVLDLSHNKIQTVHVAAFQDLHNLLSLNMSHNYLTTLSDIFLPLKSIQKLNLSYNNIHTDILFSNDILSYSEKLSELDLSFNHIPYFSFGWTVKELKVLDFSNTGLFYLNTYKELPKLTVLNVANNILKSNEEICYLSKCKRQYYPDYFDNIPNLEYLDVSNNTHDEILVRWRTYTNIYSLNLSYNHLTKLSAVDFLYLSKRQLIVDLTYNNITSIVLNDWEIKPVSEESDSSKVSLQMNSKVMNCDCYILNVLQFYQNDITLSHEDGVIANISQSSLMCKTPDILSGEYVENSEPWSMELVALFGLCLL